MHPRPMIGSKSLRRPVLATRPRSEADFGCLIHCSAGAFELRNPSPVYATAPETNHISVKKDQAAAVKSLSWAMEVH